jgi:KAP family P-loop domain
MNAPPEFDHRIDAYALRDKGGHVDALDRQSVARLLARRLLEGPGVIGVYGTWGSGKSYVLDLTIDELFRQESGVRPIVCYFQPWRYEPDSSLAPGLILELQSVDKQFPGFNPRIAESHFRQVSQLCIELWRRMRRAVAPLKPLAQAVQGLPPGTFHGQEAAAVIADVIGAVPDARQDEPVSAWDPAGIRTDMAELVRKLRTAAGKSEGRSPVDYRVVVVIDDLDRCAPDLMVDMLNWLKVHLSVDQCSYLLALDHGAAARAIVGRYREYLRDADVAYGLRYLEKIVDFEVELGRSDLVEQMAVKSAAKGAISVEEIVERALERQGVRSKEIRQLMRLPTLQSPRTMLKVVMRFREALDVVQRQQQERLGGRSDGNQLPVDYPFWLLLLVAMYYRLAPEYIEAFCDGRTPLAEATTVTGQGLSRIPQPVREFDDFLQPILRNGSAASQTPSATALAELYSAVRQITLS